MSELHSHYADDRTAAVYQTLGTVTADAVCPANADYSAWYRTDYDRPPAGYDSRKRPYTFVADWDRLRGTVDRAVYASVNYVPRDFFMDAWTGYRYQDGTIDWADGDNPLPDYADFAAYTPFVDIDLPDSLKVARTSGVFAPKDRIEDALNLWTAAFADLCGTYDAVFALDSVGGAYVMAAPAATCPIAEHFDRDRRGRIFDALTDRLNEWLDEKNDEITDITDTGDGLFEADLINQKNRLYKAPLSAHADIDAVVTPMDVRAPTYEITPLTAITDATYRRATEWATELTADYYGDCVGEIVATLWPQYAASAESWIEALDAWATDTANPTPADTGADTGSGDVAGTGGDTGVDSDMSTTDATEVMRQLDRIDAKAVADEFIVHQWNQNASTSDGATAFFPKAAPNCGGTANIFVEDKGICVDTGESNATLNVVEMALIGSSDTDWTWRDRTRTASGDAWARGVRELHRHGYDVPLYVPHDDDDISPYYELPLRGIATRYGIPTDELFDNPRHLLAACVCAKDDAAVRVPDDATPPYAALRAIAEEHALSMQDPADGILGRDTHRVAQELFARLTPDHFECVSESSGTPDVAV